MSYMTSWERAQWRQRIYDAVVHAAAGILWLLVVAALVKYLWGGLCG